MYVKVYIPKNTDYFTNGNDVPYQTEQDYYTTIDIEPSDFNNTHYIRCLAKGNLLKRIAVKEWGNIKRWKSIELDSVDIQVIR